MIDGTTYQHIGSLHPQLIYATRWKGNGPKLRIWWVLFMGLKAESGVVLMKQIEAAVNALNGDTDSCRVNLG